MDARRTVSVVCASCVALATWEISAIAQARCKPWDVDCLRKKAPKKPKLPSLPKPGGKAPDRQRRDAQRVIDLARFSLQSYSFADGDDARELRFPAGFEKTPIHRRPAKGKGRAVVDTGFRAVAYGSANARGDVVIAFTGSMSFMVDWAEVNSALVRLVHLWPASRAAYDKVVKDLRRAGWNLARAGFGKRSSLKSRQHTRNLAILALRLKQAQDFFDAVRRRRPDARIYVTGHSMGGVIAEVIGARNRKHIAATHTFDAAPGAWHLLGVGATPGGVAVTNHRRVGDVVSIEPTHVGTVCTYRFPGKREFDETDLGGRIQGPHHMTSFVKALERGMRPQRCKTPRKPALPRKPAMPRLGKAW